jgi:hypothetical protein
MLHTIIIFIIILIIIIIIILEALNFAPPVLDAVGLRVPSRNIRNLSTFSCSSAHCPTARCVVAANSVCEFIDIFSKLYLSLKSLA